MVNFNEIFKYDENSPTGLVWSIDIYSGKYYSILEKAKGDIAGSIVSSSGYCQVKFEHKIYLCHRIIWEMFNGIIPEEMFIDHIDGNKQNNKTNNLRLVNRSGNSRNCKKRVDNISGVTGVYLLENKNRSGSISQYWRATWFDNNKINNKNFSVKKLGFDIAFDQAILFRKNQIEKLNIVGYEFTERHGV